MFSCPAFVLPAEGFRGLPSPQILGHSEGSACLQVASGSADRSVYIWDVASRKVLYKLPGHNGTVNEAVFHPQEPIICSASSDRQLFLGELAT
jgi:WD40 repeat protein